MDETQPSAGNPSPDSVEGAPAFDWRGCDAYLFDIDGTLLHTRDMVHFEAFLNAIQAEFGITVSVEGIPVQGSTDPIILSAALSRAGVPALRIRALLRKAIERMAAEVEARFGELKAEPCAAIASLLAELHLRGKLLALASGNVERVGWAKVRAAHLDHYFAFGSFSDSGCDRTEIFRRAAEEARRRLANPTAKLCFVGDTPSDVESARACGIPVIAVATGIFSVTELAATSPELCIPSFQELWKLKL